MRLIVFGYSVGEYIYMLTDKGLTIKHKTYSIEKKWIYLIRRNEIKIKKKKTKGKTMKLITLVSINIFIDI